MAEIENVYWDHREARWTPYSGVEVEIPEQPTPTSVEDAEGVDVRSG